MLDRKQEESLSKFMSKVLRHTPEQFGLELDHEGFCSIQDLINGINTEKRWTDVTISDIKQVVENCPKRRYEIINGYIRANYGHSSGRLDYQEAIPPAILYHGTNTKAADIIMLEGIKPMGRKYVHLSEGMEFASLAGQRRGQLVILEVDTQRAVSDNVKFYLANHGVWLADYIPAKYLHRRQ